MKLVEIISRDSKLIEQLVEVWEKSVKITHLFLSDKEIEEFKEIVERGAHLFFKYAREGGLKFA